MKKIFSYIETHERQVLVIITLLALALRLVYLYSYLIKGLPIVGDSVGYLKWIGNVSNGDWLNPDMSFAPGMSILGFIFTKLFGNPVIGFYVYNVIVTTLIVPTLYYLGKELFSKNIGLLLAIWAIFYRDFITFGVFVLKEPTLFLFLPVALLFFIRGLKGRNRYINFVLSAFSFIWLIHMDERYFIYFPLFILAFIFMKPFNLNAIIKASGLWVTVVLILMIPWGIRNYLTFGEVVILSSRTTAFTSKVWGTDLAKMHFSESGRDIYTCTSPAEAEAFGKKHGIVPYEFGIVESRIKAFVNFWQPTFFKPTFIQYGFRPRIFSFTHNVSGLLFYGIFIPFYLIGMMLLIKKKYYLALWIAVIPITHSLMHAYMVWPLTRYRTPMNFIVVMIGLWCFQQIFFYFKKRNANPLVTN